MAALVAGSDYDQLATGGRIGAPYAGTTTTETRTQTRMQGMDIEVSITMRMDHDVVFEAGSDDTVVGRYTTTSVSAEMGGMPGLDQAPFDLHAGWPKRRPGVHRGYGESLGN